MIRDLFGLINPDRGNPVNNPIFIFYLTTS